MCTQQKQKCCVCKETKLLEQFHKDRTKKLGVKSTCKVCAKEYSSRYYTENSGRIRSRITSYSHRHIPKRYRCRLSRLKNLLTSARNRKNKEFDPDLNEEYLDKIWNDQGGACALSGKPLSIEANLPNTVSLDRIDSTEGYVRGNLQLVCAAINRMKQEFSVEDFIDFCESVANYRPKTTR